MKKARGWAGRVYRGEVGRLFRVKYSTKRRVGTGVKGMGEPNYGELLDIAMDLAASIENACWRTACGRANLHGPTPHMTFAVMKLEGWKQNNVLPLTYRGKK